MDHIAIDLGSKESQICVRTSAGEIVEEWRCATKELVHWLSKQTPARVIVETYTEAFRLADLARRHGHEDTARDHHTRARARCRPAAREERRARCSVAQ